MGILEMTNTKLAYNKWQEVVFGFSKKKLRYGFDLVVGNGEVIPEVKYILKPGMERSLETLKKGYNDALYSVMHRAVNLGVNSLQIDLEFNEPMTINLKWGEEIVHLHKETMEKYNSEYGLRCGLRVTISDIRRFDEGLHSGKYWSIIMEAFERSSNAGADLVSIESRGGQEVFSYSLIRNDIHGLIFSLGILAPIDIEHLWRNIIKSISKNTIPSGDTGCAFANSAMVLANGLIDRKISHILSAIIRAMTVPRTLIPFEVGAKGPGKDCAYENVIIKIITGYPIAMEGKIAAMAHSSLIGNISAATCDLWSNETIVLNDVFSGKTPAAILEILYYDTTLMNTAIKNNFHFILRDILVDSDKLRDPQALILSPDNAFRIAKAVMSEKDHYYRTIAACNEAITIIEENVNEMILPSIELKYLNFIKKSLQSLPDKEELVSKETSKFITKVKDFNPRNYNL